ncbi:MAG: HNH endonuclease [Alphaproteobacteria bacterium]
MNDDFKTITRSDGLPILVDAADFAWLNQRKWFPGGPDGKYAARSEMTGGVTRRIYLHRELMSPPPGVVVDHINADPLDNRRCNLRLATRGQNAANKSNTRNPTGFFGVCHDPTQDRFQASVTQDGARFRGPWRKDAKTAAEDYDRLARGIHGEFGRYNFPGPGEQGIRREGVHG